MNASRMAAVVFAVVLLLYPLSMGPAYGYCYKHGIAYTGGFLSSGFYFPLEVMSRNQTVGRIFGWYISLWIDEDEPVAVNNGSI